MSQGGNKTSTDTHTHTHLLEEEIKRLRAKIYSLEEENDLLAVENERLKEEANKVGKDPSKAGGEGGKKGGEGEGGEGEGPGKGIGLFELPENLSYLEEGEGKYVREQVGV